MQVREVICPSCSHRFMWMDVEEGPTIKKYRSVETGETFHTAVCPQCGKRVILLPVSYTHLTLPTICSV